MSKKLTILVDVDGIVADTLPTWLEWIERLTGVKATPADITNWTLHACPPLNKLKPNQLYDILNMPGFNANLPLMPGAAKELFELHNQGHNLYLLTARFGDVCISETLKWVKEHLPFINPEKQMGFMADKHLVRGDVLIDDKGETLIKYQECNPSSKIVTINYPYNQMKIPGVIRVDKSEDSWFAIRKVIEDISDENL